MDLLGLDALKPSTVVPPARPQRPIAITQSSPHSPLPPKPSPSLGQGQGSASMLRLTVQMQSPILILLTL